MAQGVYRLQVGHRLPELGRQVLESERVVLPSIGVCRDERIEVRRRQQIRLHPWLKVQRFDLPRHDVSGAFDPNDWPIVVRRLADAVACLELTDRNVVWDAK